MTDQTPSTEEVRYGYRTGVTAPILPVEAGDAFDAWLAKRDADRDAARDRETAAKAWDEGANTAWERSTPEVNGTRYYWRHEGEPRNPYRIGAGDE